MFLGTALTDVCNSNVLKPTQERKIDSTSGIQTQRCSSTGRVWTRFPLAAALRPNFLAWLSLVAPVVDYEIAKEYFEHWGSPGSMYESEKKERVGR